MSQLAPTGTKSGSSNAYAASSGNQNLFNVARNNFGMGQVSGSGAEPGKQVIRGEPQRSQPVRSKTNISCTVFLFILLVLAILIGAAGIALCIVYFNTDSSTKGYKIGGIIMGVIVIIVSIIMIVLVIFKQTHKRPWRERKEKNFFYSQDARRHPEKNGQITVDDLIDNDRRMYGNNAKGTSSQYTGRPMTNNYTPLNNSSGDSTISSGLPNASYEIQSAISTSQFSPETSSIDNQPAAYSVYNPKPAPIALTSKGNSGAEPSTQNNGNNYPTQYQTTVRAPQVNLLTMPAQNQPVVQTARSETRVIPQAVQPTMQTTRQDLISFANEHDAKASRNRETFATFDHPSTSATFHSNHSGTIPATRSNANETVIVRRVPISTMKPATQSPSGRLVVNRSADERNYDQ